MYGPSPERKGACRVWVYSVAAIYLALVSIDKRSTRPLWKSARLRLISGARSAIHMRRFGARLLQLVRAGAADQVVRQIAVRELQSEDGLDKPRPDSC
jgi:hypothetical protein